MTRSTAGWGVMTFQFVAQLRERHLHTHRWMVRNYALAFAEWLLRAQDA